MVSIMILTGCMNTPQLGLRVCQDHENTTARFSDYYKKQKRNNTQGASTNNKDEFERIEAEEEDTDRPTSDDDEQNDNTEQNDKTDSTTKKEKNGSFQGVIRICNTKETRTSTLYEVRIHVKCKKDRS